MTQTNDPTLMLVGAHHDDNELMAGTITKHRKAGWRVVSVVMTAGRWTSSSLSDENVKVRNDESLAAAKLLDIETAFLGFGEGSLRATEEVCRGVVETIRKYRPTVLVTHPPKDYHSDHMETCRAVTDAIYRSLSNTYAAKGEPWGLIRLYYCEPWVMPFEPDVYVDVSAYIDLKRDALACHKSQLPDGPAARGHMIDVEVTRSRYRGFESGYEYAEAFRFVPRPHLVRTANLLQ